MLRHVLPVDVRDDRQRRLRVRDVAEILVRADTEVDAARFDVLLQLADGVQVR